MSKFFNKIDAFSDRFNITKRRVIFFLVPVVILLVAVIVFAAFSITGGGASNGINLGLDFTGGTSITVKMPNLSDSKVFDEKAAELVQIIKDAGYTCSEPQLTGTGSEAAIYVKYQNQDSDIDASNAAIVDALQAKYSDLVYGTDIVVESISSTAATRLLKEAAIAIAVIWAVIFVYILIRFEIWSGIASLIGLIHDVLMMVCLTVIFRVEISITYVAAIITIISYSINNTIVIFDRVREHVKLAPLDVKFNTVEMVVNKSVGEMLTRTAGSSFTTMIPIILLACIGTESLSLFALPILFGLISGTYSAIFISPNIYVLLKGARVRSKFKGYVGAQKADGTVSAPVDKAKAKKANKTKAYKHYKRK